MLPTGISRDMIPPSKIRCLKKTNSVELLGRTRKERLLDGFYNRQSLFLKKMKIEKPISNLTTNVMEKIEKSIKEDNIKTKKVEDPVYTSKPSAKQVISSLVKHSASSSRNKLLKVIDILDKLLTNDLSTDNNQYLLDLFLVLASNKLITSLGESRQKVISFSIFLIKKIKNIHNDSLNSSESSQWSVTEAELSPSSNSNTKILLNDWLNILSLSTLWHNKLFTDDSFQFHEALSQISQAITYLPNIDTYSSIDSVNSSTIPSIIEYYNQFTLTKKFSPNNLDCCIKQEYIDSEENIFKNFLPIYHPFSINNQDLNNIDYTFNDFSNSQIPSTNVGNSENISTCSKKENVKNCSINDLNCNIHSDGLSEPITKLNKPYLYLPPKNLALCFLRIFVMNTLDTIFQYSKTQWSKPSVSRFFNNLHMIRKLKFIPVEVTRIEGYQSDIRFTGNNSLKQTSTMRIPTAGESLNPICDGREEKIYSVNGTSVWSAKQFGL